MNKIKLANGSVVGIDEIPLSIQEKYKETFEIDMKWLVEAAARRSKWIDQSASTNIFMKTTSGRDLAEVYQLAWETGLKTTYYLRTLGASQISKFSVATPTQISEPKASEPRVDAAVMSSAEPKACLISDPDCEACQ